MCIVCFSADSLFGTALSEQFAEGDDVAAPPFLVRCTTELEKRLQETGVHSLLSALSPDTRFNIDLCCR